MTTRIKVWYSDVDGEDIPTPKNCPEELEIRGHGKDEITDESVRLLIREHIKRAGGGRCDVMFIWDIVTEVKQKYTVH